MATTPSALTPEQLRQMALEALSAKAAVSDMALEFRDMRDFSKQVASHLKNMGKDAEKLTSAIKQTAANVASATNMMDIFRAKSIASRFAAQEIANGIGLTKDRMQKLNTEAEKYAALEKATAEDRILGESLVKSLTDELGVSQKKLLDSKTAILGIDARLLTQARAQWEMSGKSLAQLEAQAAKDKTQLEAEDKRLEILEERRKADFALEQKLKMAAEEKDAATRDQISKAAKEAHMQKMRDLEAEYNATGMETDTDTGVESKATLFRTDGSMKDLKNQTRGVEQFREKYYRQHLVNQALLAEAEEDRHKKDLLNLKTRMGYSAHFLRTEDTNLGLLGQQFNAAKGFLDKAKLIPPQFMLLDFILKSSYDRFIALDKAAEDFRKLTGFSNTQMKELRKDAEAVNLQFAQMGVSIENVYKSAKALTDIFGRTSLVSKEALKNVSLLSVNLGVSEESSANVLSTFQGLGGATEESAMNIIKVGAGLSEKTGVPFKLVMQDVANASEETLKMIGANPSQLMKAAIAARSMGLELNKVMATQRKLLDFNSSITDELEASAMLGKNINFQLARQLAFEGRVEDSQRAILDTVKRAGDFNRMNVYQREALAKASGMELKDLTKMMAVDSQREAILNGSDENKKRILRAQEEELKKLKERNKLDSEDLVTQNQKALMQQKMQGIMTKLKNIFDSISAAMGDILEPIITPLAAIIIPAFRLIGILAKALGFILRSILTPITWIAEAFGWVADKLDGLISGMEEWGGWIKKTFEVILIGIGVLATPFILYGAYGMLGKLFFGKSGPSALMNMLKAPFTAVGSFVKTIRTEGVGGAIKNMLPFGKANTAATAAPLLDKNGNPLRGAALKAAQDKAAREAAAAGATKVASTAADASKTVAGAASSAEAVRPTAGLGIRVFLTNLSGGLRSMAGFQVLKGALNLIPASLGLVAMVPGYVGARLLASLDGTKLLTSLVSLSAGLISMGTTPVFKGALGLGAAAVGFATMVIGLPVMSFIAAFGTALGTGLAAFGTGLAALGGNKYAWAGVGIIAALALTAVGFGYAIKLAAEGILTFTESFQAFADLEWSTIGKMYVFVVSVGAAFTLLGGLAPVILMGAGALMLAGSAMTSFGENISKSATAFDSLFSIFEKISTIDGESLIKIGIGFTALGISLAGMAVFALPMLLSIKILSAFVGVLEKAKPSLETLPQTLEKISNLNLGGAAIGIEQLGTALTRFGSGSAAAGVGSLVGRLLGGDPIKRLEKFSDMGSKLRDTADSINTIASATAKFGMVDAFADAVSRLVFSLERLNDQMDKTSTVKIASLAVLSSIAGKGQENTETTPAAAAGPSGVEAKLDELITLLKDGGISVNLDGDKVSRSMASRGRE